MGRWTKEPEQTGGGDWTGDWTNELVSRAAVVVVVVGGTGGAVSEWSLLVQQSGAFIHSFIHWESSLAPFTH